MHGNAIRVLRTIALGCLAAAVVLCVHATQRSDEADSLSVPIVNECAPLYQLRDAMNELEHAVDIGDAVGITTAGTKTIDTAEELIGIAAVIAPVRAALMNEAGISIVAVADAIESTKVQVEAEIMNQIHFSDCPDE